MFKINVLCRLDADGIALLSEFLQVGFNLCTSKTFIL